MNKLQIVDMNGQQTIDSRLVAEALEMQHKDLLEKIRNYEQILIGGKFRSLDFFISSTYKDSRNREKPCYMLTKKGCEMVANKTTGQKGVIFTAMYVEAFNQMEQQPRLPSEPMEVLRLMFEAQTQTNEKVAKHDQRIQELEDNKLLNPGEYNYISKAVRRKVKSVMSELNMDLVGKQRSQIYHAINRDLNCFVGIKTRSQFKAKDFDKALEFIENWQLSYTDKRLIEQMSFDI